MDTNGSSGRRRGRPRGGIRRGERLRDYPTFTVRVPPRTRAMIRALCKRKQLPAWAMLRHVVVCYVRDLPAVERRWVVRRSRPSHRPASI
jgi:hypothetical protein